MAEGLTKEQIHKIEQELASGQYIQAIKLYREMTGKHLTEAKEFMDALIVKLAELDPEKYAKLSQRSGCASAIVCGMGMTFAVAWLIHSAS